MDKHTMTDTLGKNFAEDSPCDIPASVKPFNAKDLHNGRYISRQNEDGSRLYIWRKADEFVKQWLPEKGYSLLRSAVFDDCIGYRCRKDGFDYTVFMYAYGNKKTVQIDGEFCGKLAKLPFAKGSIISVLCLNVSRSFDGSSFKYRVRNHSGSDKFAPELWRLMQLDGTYILCEERIERLLQFMYAFNREDTDIYDVIITERYPSINGIPGAFGDLMNDWFYAALRILHRKYGDMKLGYSQHTCGLYGALPYLEGLGFFGWSTDNSKNRIIGMTLHPFDGEEDEDDDDDEDDEDEGDNEDEYGEIIEFIKAGQREPDGLFDFVPTLIKAVPLPPVPSERFAVKLLFDNGECRKYVLPIAEADEAKPSVSYRGRAFSDDTWASARVVARHESRYANYPECGAAVAFDNGSTLAGTLCYIDGTPYSEPLLTDEIVYSDGKYSVRKI